MCEPSALTQQLKTHCAIIRPTVNDRISVLEQNASLASSYATGSAKCHCNFPCRQDINSRPKARFTTSRKLYAAATVRDVNAPSGGG